MSGFILAGCSNKINQTGSWLVSSDSSIAPVYFDSMKDSSKVTNSQVNVGLATGSSTALVLGKVPWTQADVLIGFSGFGPVDSAQAILSTTITLYRTSYVLQSPGTDVHNLQLAGFTLDTIWNASTLTWDSVSTVGYGSQNIISSYLVTDSTIVLQIDSSVVRDWAMATSDSTYKNNGFIIRPQNTSGVLSVYGPAGVVSSYYPVCTVVYIQAGVVDTTSLTSSYATAVAQTSIGDVAPKGNYRYVQAGTGERENIVFDLSRLPRYSIINNATLTLFSDTTAGAPYTTDYNSDSLQAFYVVDPTTWSYSSSYPATGVPSGNQCTFNVTMIVQHMVNAQNYGFLISQYSDLDNIDTRFVYDESAPDSLRPRLTITYTQTSRR